MKTLFPKGIFPFYFHSGCPSGANYPGSGLVRLSMRIFWEIELKEWRINLGSSARLDCSLHEAEISPELPSPIRDIFFLKEYALMQSYKTLCNYPLVFPIYDYRPTC